MSIVQAGLGKALRKASAKATFSLSVKKTNPSAPTESTVVLKGKSADKYYEISNAAEGTLPSAILHTMSSSDLPGSRFRKF